MRRTLTALVVAAMSGVVTVAAPALAQPATTPETTPATTPATSPSTGTTAAKLAPSTLADLDTAMHGEAFAWAKYTLYSESAARGAAAAAAKLWAATSTVERGEHFAEHADLAGLVGTDAQNLKAAIAGENYETTTMYPQFAREARRQGAPNAAKMFTEIARDEARHRDAYKKALQVLTTGKGTMPAPWTVDAVTVKAGRALNHGKTAANLLTAMHGEATASVKYDMFAEQARRSGNKALADLFASTAQVEFREHYSAEAQRVGLVSSVRNNLRESARGEHQEATVMYPGMARRAAKAGDKAVAKHFLEVAKDEAKHSAAFAALAKR